jgi:hypothetical protein
VNIDAEFPYKIFQTQFNNTLERSSSWFHSRNARMVQDSKSINVIQNIDRIKPPPKNHTIISIDAEKGLKEIQHPFMINVLKQLEIK